LLLVQKQAPAIPTAYLTQLREPDANIYLDRPSPWTAGFDPRKYGRSVARAIKAAGGAIWRRFTVTSDRRSIAEAHKLGLKVLVWTVNSPEDMARLIDLGVDGIISDRPRRAARHCSQEGHCSAAARTGIALTRNQDRSPASRFERLASWCTRPRVSDIAHPRQAFYRL